MRIINAPEPYSGVLQGGLPPVASSPDVTAPVLSMPSGTPVGVTGVSGMVMTDEAGGTLYYFVSQSATAPTIANLKAGTGADASGNQAVAATGMLSVSATGLVEDNTYYIHYLQTDAAGNDSNIVSTTGILLTDSIPTPTLVLLSSAGELLSFEIQGLVPEQVSGNYDWFVEVAGDSGFTTGPGAEGTVRTSQRQILLSDFLDDDADGNPEVEPFEATQSLPNGDVWVRISLKSDNGSTGDPSNVINHNINQQADILWSTTDKYSLTVINNNDLTMTHNSQNVSFRGGRATSGRSVGREYVEFLIESETDDDPPQQGSFNSMYVGITDETADMNATIRPGNAGVKGVSIRVDAAFVYANDSVEFDGTDISADGVIGLLIDYDLKRCWFYYNNVILTGDPDNDTGGFTYDIDGNVFVWAAPRINTYENWKHSITLQPDAASQTYAAPSGSSPINGATTG